MADRAADTIVIDPPERVVEILKVDARKVHLGARFGLEIADWVLIRAVVIDHPERVVSAAEIDSSHGSVSNDLPDLGQRSESLC